MSKTTDGIEFPKDFNENSNTNPAVSNEPANTETPQTNPPAAPNAIEPKPKQQIKTWTDALVALPAKFSQLKFDERRTTVELGFAQQIIKGNDMLQKCDPKTIFDAVIYAARMEITLNPAFAFAYLVPRGTKCCLDVGYRGWCAAAKSYGVVKHLDGYVVYEDEEFIWLPSEMYLKHVPVIAKNESEQNSRTVKAAYAMAILPDGSRVYEVIPAWELERIKNVSPAARKGFSPYKDWAGEMTRKAPIKRLAKKLLPLQTDERIRAMFEAERENDSLEQSRTVAETFSDAEVIE